MAIDLDALRAKIAAQKAAKLAATPPQTPEETKNEISNKTDDNVVAGNAIAVVSTSNDSGSSSTNLQPVPVISPPATLGTSKTTEIDHIDFLSKMNSLASAIHTQHPTMPVLLRQIHKILRDDPELVTTLDDDAVGVIVRGLQLQTKTELVAEVVKKTSSGRSKKVHALSVDML